VKNLMSKVILGIGLGLIAVPSSLMGTDESCGGKEKVASFKPHFDEFMRSVVEKDWGAFVKFFDVKRAFYAKLPMGERHSAQEFLDGQKLIFDSPVSKFSYREVSITEVAGSDGKQCLAEIDAHFQNGGPELHLNIKLKFEWIGDRWVLIHDVNEKIEDNK
jgi:hypothetical protein